MTKLSIVVTGDSPPSEFRIFGAGVVESTKGPIIFDAKAAESVMAEYQAHGIDLMIDYDHASLAYVSLDPAQAGKAAGWFNLEVRGGELWATNVRWTPPAAEALHRKEWRFMSPAFNTDEEGRVTSLLNVAITNLPATRNLEPLMAASITALGENSMLSAETIKQALDALIAGDEAKCMELLKGIVAEAATGDSATEDAPPPVGDGGADDATEPAVMTGDKPAEVAAALSAIQSLSGKAFVASVGDIRTWHASHVELATERKKLAEREAVLENAERRELGVKRVKFAGKSPAETWSSPSANELKPYFASMPIGDLRKMVEDEIGAFGGKPGAPKVPVATASTQLSDRERQMLSARKIDPAAYAAIKNQMRST